MRYIKPPDFKSVKDLQEHYKKLEQDITDLLFSDASINTAEELNKKLSLALSASLSYLTKINKTYVEKELPIAFKEGQASSSNLKEVPKKTAAAILAKQGFKYAKNGFSYDTYIELQTATKTALNGIKTQVNDIIKDLRKDGQDSLYNVRETLLKELQKHNLTSVKYSNGAEMPLNAYAAMVARSARIETTNISAIGGALEDGTDLVKMTTMPQCCRLCGAYQGKVYSITGRDKRFPALFKTVLKNGYALPHPNCRHEFLPWFEEMEAPEDIEKAIKQSKIKYDSKGNLVDVRYQKDIEAYQAWQAGNRQRNREMLEFEQMQAYYKGKEDEMPYKTLASFRRARRAKSENYQESRKEWTTTSRRIEKNHLTNLGNNGIIEVEQSIVYDMYSDKLPNVGDSFYFANETTRVKEIKNHNGIVAVILDNERTVVLGKLTDVEKTPLKNINDWDFKQDATRLIAGGYADDKLQISHRPYGYTGNDLLVKKLLDDNKYSDLPMAIKSDDFDAISEENFIFVHRGVKDGNGKTAQQINEEFANNKDIWVGRGLFGNGTYTSGGKWLAEIYGNGKEESIMTLAIPKTAKIINAKELDRAVKQSGAQRPLNVEIASWTDTEYLQKGQRATGSAIKTMLNDYTFKAVRLGADIIQVDPEDWLKVMNNPESVKQYAAANGYKLEPHYVVLNRGVVIYRGK